MSASNSFETALLQHIFNNAAIANIGDAAGLPASIAAGSLFVSLHTADPGEAGNQATSEAAYTGYARVAVARTAGGWTVTGPSATNTSAITFGQCTAGSATVTHFGIGTASTGAGVLLFSGNFSASLAITVNATPEIAAGQLSTTAD